MKNQDWKGKKKEHYWCFNGIHNPTNREYSTCEHCDKMKVNGRMATKKEIEEYDNLIKNNYDEFVW